MINKLYAIRLRLVKSLRFFLALLCAKKSREYPDFQWRRAADHTGLRWTWIIIILKTLYFQPFEISSYLLWESVIILTGYNYCLSLLSYLTVALMGMWLLHRLARYPRHEILLTIILSTGLMYFISPLSIIILGADGRQFPFSISNNPDCGVSVLNLVLGTLFSVDIAVT